SGCGTARPMNAPAGGRATWSAAAATSASMPCSQSCRSLSEVPTRPGVPVRDILDTHPQPTSLDRDLLVRCIDECFTCTAVCTSCADACLAEDDVPELTGCIRLCLDWPDVCDP